MVAIEVFVQEGNKEVFVLVGGNMAQLKEYLANMYEALCSVSNTGQRNDTKNTNK